MEEDFYDSLEEDSFCECQSQLSDSDHSEHVTPEPQKNPESNNVLPIFKRETSKTTDTDIRKKRFRTNRKIIIRDTLPVRDKKQNKTYLNLFYTKIKYPVVGGGDVLKFTTGSDTTRANYDPSSRVNSAVSKCDAEEFFTDKECSSDEESFYEKFIAEDEIKSKISCPKKTNLSSTSGTISNFLSVSEQCLSKTRMNIPNNKKRTLSRSSSIPSKSTASGVDEYNHKLQLLRKRQYYGQKASIRNRAIMEEAQMIKNFKEKLKV
ncbi:hypothetical protein WA026_004056 [Henosepilachna vigintioctopunctata]|uniref:Uncharacterized protein n=1 Tax=Henosepilachna vigintioctopunctata TaxID=420089 RepID=A0AAW1UDK7_9CUCU